MTGFIVSWPSKLRYLVGFALTMVAVLAQAEYTISSESEYSDKELFLTGQYTQGGMIVGKTLPKAKVMLNTQTLKVSSDGHFVFGFGRDGKSGDVLKVILPEGKTITEVMEVAPREYNIQRINGVPKRTVNPSPESLARIKKDSRQVGLARKHNFDYQAFKDTFIWPVIGPITGVYGSQRVYNGKPGRPHYGIDIAMPTGTVVVAPAAGKITLAHDDMFYSGGTMMIDHGHGISSSFLHLSKMLVKEGDEVKQGQPVAEVGSTGRSTGPHLDWRMNWFKRRIDPSLLVPDMNELLEQQKAVKQQSN